MGIKKHYTEMSRRQMYNITKIKLDPDKSLSFVCDRLIILPTKKKYIEGYNRIDVALFRDGLPTFRLVGNSDLIFVESGNRSCKMDVLRKSGLIGYFPTMGLFRVDWDGSVLHIRQIGDET